MSAQKILQLSDLHILPHAGDRMLGIDTEYFFRRCLDHAIQQNGPFDLILLTGDLAQDPCTDSYQRIGVALAAYETPCICLPGNHDDEELMKQHLTNQWVSCAKHQSLENWQIICLNTQKENSQSGLLAKSELAFLKQTLLDHPDSPTLIAMHHPCFSTHSLWLDTMQIENSQELLTTLADFPHATTLICGHVHQELAQESGHLKLLSAPSTCFQFTPRSAEFSIDRQAPGYRILELQPTGAVDSVCYRIPEAMNSLDLGAHGY